MNKREANYIVAINSNLVIIAIIDIFLIKNNMLNDIINYNLFTNIYIFMKKVLILSIINS